MAGLLRVAGILIISGTLILVTSGYALLYYASIAATREDLVQPGWIDNATWIGIILMVTGLVAALAALLQLLKNMTGPNLYSDCFNEINRLIISSQPICVDETKQRRDGKAGQT